MPTGALPIEVGDAGEPLMMLAGPDGSESDPSSADEPSSGGPELDGVHLD